MSFKLHLNDLLFRMTWNDLLWFFFSLTLADVAVLQLQ